MTVAMPTSPGNYFHLLRWQCLSGRHKPLIVFTPKSMLRLKAAASPVTEFTTGSFRPLIGPGRSRTPPCAASSCAPARCTTTWPRGARSQHVAADTAIARVERLYPLPVSELCAELARYPGAESVTWVQEEPANMGAWPTLALKLPRVLNREVGVISLPASSAPAAGSAKLHATTHREIIETAIPQGSLMYFTDRGIEELEERRGEEQVSMAWLAGRLRDFVDLNPGFETPWTGWPAGWPGSTTRRTDQTFPEGPCGRPGLTRRACPTAPPPSAQSRYILTLVE